MRSCFLFFALLGLSACNVPSAGPSRQPKDKKVNPVEVVKTVDSQSPPQSAATTPPPAHAAKTQGGVSVSYSAGWPIAV